MLVFGPEEKTNYEYSISNLATLKVFFDAGVNVSGFENFIMDLNYNDSATKKIFAQGCIALFHKVTEYSPYENKEDEAILEGFCKIGILDYTPEFAYEITDPKLDKIFSSSLKDTFKEFVEKSVKEHISDDSYFDGNVVTAKNSVIIAMNTVGQLHEVAITMVHILNEMNRMYELLMKGD